MIEALLNDRQLVPDNDTARPLETLHRNRPRRVQTIFGSIKIKRCYFHHREAKLGRAPLDEALDLVGGHTPAVARLICRASTQCGSYIQAAEDLEAYTGLALEGRGFGRLVAQVAPTLNQALATLEPDSTDMPPVPVMYVSSDGTGIPARRAELKGRKGKQVDGSARTREAKLGCVFTQTCCDKDGEPLRDPDSTSYVGTLDACRRAGTLLREEAYRRGYGKALQTVYIGDGASWVWENARINFPGATQILDFYHAAEHLGELARAIFGSAGETASTCQSRWCTKMKRDSAAPIVVSAKRLLARRRDQMDDEQIKVIQREINYFQTNAERTRYGDFRAQGYFIGSGVVEAGCKTVIGRRMKQSGMFWSVSGAEHLLSLRCLLLGPHLDAAWEARKPILAAQRNHARRWCNSNN